jgi:hypothetical protein
VIEDPGQWVLARGWVARLATACADPRPHRDPRGRARLNCGNAAEPFEGIEDRSSCCAVAATGDEVDVVAEPANRSGSGPKFSERVVEFASRRRCSGGDLVVEREETSRWRADGSEVDHDGAVLLRLNGLVHCFD